MALLVCITLNVDFCEIYIRICTLGFIQSGIFTLIIYLKLVPTNSGVLVEGAGTSSLDSRATCLNMDEAGRLLPEESMVGRIMASPKEVHILILQSCEPFATAKGTLWM